MLAHVQRVIVAIAALSVVSPVAVNAADEITAYTGATLVDPGMNTVVPNGIIVVNGMRIDAVGAANDIKIPKGAKTVALRGKWILPGYIDVHAHMAGPGGAAPSGDPYETRASTEEQKRVFEHINDVLARHLRSGTTTVLDIGGPAWTVKLRDEIKPTIPAPRLYAVGPIIGPPRPILGQNDSENDYTPVTTPAEAVAAVRARAVLKVDMIKFYMVPAEHTGKPFEGFLPAFEAAFAEAHKLGIRTTAHAMRLPIAKMGVDAGLDTLAHGILDTPADEAFLKKMKERGIVMAPTLMVLVGPITTMSGNVSFIEEEKKWGDPEAIESLIKASARQKERQGPLDQRRAVLRAGGLEIAQRNTKLLSDAGVTLAVGTDAGLLGVIHGPSIFREMYLMAEAGLTPQQVLAAASLGGAKFLNKEADLGSLTKGKFADMVVLDADPLVDIHNASKISMVIANGKAWTPDQILPPKK